MTFSGVVVFCPLQLTNMLEGKVCRDQTHAAIIGLQRGIIEL
jgi:hypothetical protein